MASSSRACPPTPASSGSCPSTTSSRRATRARSTDRAARRGRSSACRWWPTWPTCPTTRIDLVFVCTPAAANAEVLRDCAKKGIRAAFIASAGYGEAGPEGRAAPGRAGRAGRRAGHARRRAERPGRRVHPRPPVRPDRGAVPAGRRDRDRFAVGQLHLLVHELRRADGHRREQGGVGGQRRGRHDPRLPRVLRGRRRHPRRARLRRGRPGRASVLRTDPRRGGPQAPRDREGRCDRGRSARRRVAHRVARQRRPGVRRHVPSGRHHPCEHDRGGVRDGRHLRDPTPPEGRPRRRAHHRRRLGGRDGRRDRAHVARPHPAARTTCAPPSTPSSRRAGAGTTPSTSPGPRHATRSPR